MTRRVVTVREAREWAQLYDEGWPIRWICELAGRQKCVVTEALRLMGVRMRPPKPHPQWCDECCTYQYLNHRTGWCSSCTEKAEARGIQSDQAATI